jgi:hypothetical protein
MPSEVEAPTYLLRAFVRPSTSLGMDGLEGDVIA